MPGDEAHEAAAAPAGRREWGVKTSASSAAWARGPAGSGGFVFAGFVFAGFVFASFVFAGAGWKSVGSVKSDSATMIPSQPVKRQVV
eukprot:scaffold1850_cov96-Isochrysis_galbana.AAC.1